MDTADSAMQSFLTHCNTIGDHHEDGKLNDSSPRLRRLEFLDELIAIDRTEVERDFKPSSRQGLIKRVDKAQQDGLVHADNAQLPAAGAASLAYFTQSAQLTIAHACQPGCPIGATSRVFSRIRGMMPSIHNDVHALLSRSGDASPMVDYCSLSPDDRMLLASIGAMRTLAAHPTEANAQEADAYLELQLQRTDTKLPTGGVTSPAIKATPRKAAADAAGAAAAASGGSASPGAGPPGTPGAPSEDTSIAAVMDSTSFHTPGRPVGPTATALFSAGEEAEEDDEKAAAADAVQGPVTECKQRFTPPTHINRAVGKWFYSKSASDDMKKPTVAAYVRACQLMGGDAVAHVACAAFAKRHGHQYDAYLPAIRALILNVALNSKTELADTLQLPVWMSQYSGYSIDSESPHFGYSVGLAPDANQECTTLGLQSFQSFNPSGVSSWLQQLLLASVAKVMKLHFNKVKQLRTDYQASDPIFIQAVDAFLDSASDVCSRQDVDRAMTDEMRFRVWAGVDTASMHMPAVHAAAAVPDLDID